MGIPAGHFKVVMQGTGLGSEIWQTGCWWKASLGGVSSLSDAQTFVNDAATDWASFWNSWKPGVSPYFSWVNLKAYYYDGGATAKYVVQSTPSAAPGTLTGNPSPYDGCAVLSLRTQLSGRSYRGRMYLPFHSNCIANTGLFQVSVTSIPSAYATLAAAMRGNTIPTDPVVVSQKLTSSDIVATATIDAKPDVQRRRINRQAPGTVTSATVTTF